MLLAATGDPTPVTIEVFSDFQCPYCAQFAKPVHELAAKGVPGVQAQVKFRHFPLGFHPDAQLASQAVVAAERQGKFWEMHDALFANQSAIKRGDLVIHATKLGLDVKRFEKDLDSDDVKKQVEADKAEGARLKVNGTPTFFVNGKEYSGTRTYEQLSELIGGEQRRAKALEEIPPSAMAKGPADAPVTIEFFADLQSPVSRPALQVIQAVASQFQLVRLQFRNFPLAFHPQAGLAHDAAMTAARHGRFWEFAAYILEHQESLREQDLIAHAGTLGLDATDFAKALQEHRYTPRVDADLADGLKRGLRGSPVTFVGDKRFDGVPNLAALATAVQEALKK